MASVNMNATQLRQWDRGGRLILTTSSDTITLNNKLPATLKITDGLVLPIEYKDAGDPKVPIAGDKEYSEIELDFRFTYDSAASVRDLDNFLRLAPTTGLITTFTTYIDFPQYKGVTNNWKRLAYASCFIVPGWQIIGGSDYDRITGLKIRSITETPTESIVTT